MTEEEMKIWRQAMDKIGWYLKVARAHMLKGEWDLLRLMLQQARTIYNGVKHLKPLPGTAPRGKGPWWHKMPKPTRARVPTNPVNIDALRASRLRLNLRLDPLIILELEDMLVDYLIEHYGTPEQKWQKCVEDGVIDLFWLDFLNGRLPRTDEEYRREFYRKFVT